MNKLLISSVFLIVSLAIAFGDEAADLKLEEEKRNEAKDTLKDILEIKGHDYLKGLVRILSTGVDSLEEATKKTLESETDATKRKAVIDYAFQSYRRLTKYVKESKQEIPSWLF